MPRQQDVGKPPIISATPGENVRFQPSPTESQPDFDVTIGTLNSRKRNQPTSEKCREKLYGKTYFLPYSPPVAEANSEVWRRRRTASSVIFLPSRSVT